MPQITFRKGIAADATTHNPVLASGEPGYETDTGKVKIGDGTTAWNSLAYATFGITTATHEGTLTDGVTINWDVGADPSAKVTLGGNRTLANPSNMAAGGRYLLRVIQDGTGSRTLSFGAAYKWAGGSVPTPTALPGSVDVFEFYCNGSIMYGRMTANYT